MQYYLHIAQSQVHIARSYGVTFTRTTFVLRGEILAAILSSIAIKKMSKMMPLVSVLLYKLHKR